MSNEWALSPCQVFQEDKGFFEAQKVETSA
jgi:hypothetical protein